MKLTYFYVPQSTRKINSSRHTTSWLITVHLQSEEYSTCDVWTAAPSVDCGVDELLSDCALRTSAASGWSGSTTFKGWKNFDSGEYIKIWSAYLKHGIINLIWIKLTRYHKYSPNTEFTVSVTPVSGSTWFFFKNLWKKKKRQNTLQFDVTINPWHEQKSRYYTVVHHQGWNKTQNLTWLV